MKITSKAWMGKETTERVSLYVEKQLEPSGYDGGALEQTANRSNNTLEALGRLVEILADKGVLNVEDVCKIAGATHEKMPILVSDA